MKRLVVKAAYVIVFLAALIFGAISTEAASQIGEIRISDSKGDWGFPNPYRHYPRGPGYVRMGWVFDTLVWKDQKGYIAGLAEAWSFDAEKLAFTFKLNPKAKWHDGRPLTAEDVVFSLEYFKKHPYSWITIDHVSRAEARGLHMVVIYLSRPYSPFLSDIGGTMPILPRHIWESVEDPKRYNAPKAFIGSGPDGHFIKADSSYASLVLNPGKDGSRSFSRVQSSKGREESRSASL
jgi:peptide/nickel transport system substrate-binding protein